MHVQNTSTSEAVHGMHHTFQYTSSSPAYGAAVQLLPLLPLLHDLAAALQQPHTPPAAQFPLVLLLLQPQPQWNPQTQTQAAEH
jgi:hypothetical protein